MWRSQYANTDGDLQNGNHFNANRSSRTLSPTSTRSSLRDNVAHSRIRRAAQDDMGQAYKDSLQENRRLAKELSTLDKAQTSPYSVEVQRLEQQVFDLRVQEYGTSLRAHLYEQHAVAQARAMEHQTALKASQSMQALEQRAAMQVQQACQHSVAVASDAVAMEARRASLMQRNFHAELASVGAHASEEAAALRRADQPRLEAEAVAAAQRLTNTKLIEADRRTAEASAAREMCERLVLKQLDELQEHAANNARLQTEGANLTHRLRSQEELNARLSRRLRDAEESNVELMRKVYMGEEQHRELLNKVRVADPILAACLRGEGDEGGPESTAAVLESENAELREELLQATEALEEIADREAHRQHAHHAQERQHSARGHSARSSTMHAHSGGTPRVLTPGRLSRIATSPRIGSARTVSGGATGSARTSSSRNASPRNESPRRSGSEINQGQSRTRARTASDASHR